VTQEWDLLDPELALAKLGMRLVLSQMLKYDSEVFFMFFHTLRIYQNVMNEHHDKLVQLRHENRVDEVHEVCHCIRQPKGHDRILIETISRREGHLGYIFGTNLDLVIVGAEINFGEHLGSR
jgi:hypothetical protein